MTEKPYYVPEKSPWPIMGSSALFVIAVGLVNTLHGNASGPYIMTLGFGVLVVMLFGWFNNVIRESLSGLYNERLDRSFRWGMIWFIVSEVFFFLAFFGALFYVRVFVIHWLGGEGTKALSGTLLWPNFTPSWPLLRNPDPAIIGPRSAVSPWEIPLLNTILLLTSSVTITWAHHALKDNNRRYLIIGTALTIILGWTFLIFQAREYWEAYEKLGLTLGSGIYGSTFFILTGFHGAHVTLGSIMLFVVLLRCLKGHFTPTHHFAFEASAWYWHFVDVVWVMLFIFVYCI